MLPEISRYQCLVLHRVKAGIVTFSGDIFDSGRWLMPGTNKQVDVTRQVNKLIDLALVRVLVDFPTIKIVATTEGHEMLKVRPLHLLLQAMKP